MGCCDGECLDLMSDAENCGSCGHDCHAAPCEGGNCALVTLADELLKPTFIAVDGTHVYWTAYTANSISKVPLDGGPITVLADGQVGPQGIAVGNGEVFWTTSVASAVLKVPIGGGTPIELYSEGPGAYDIVVNTEHIYFTFLHFGTHSVLRMPVLGGATADVTSNLGTPKRLAVDAASLYWTDSDSHTVMKMPLGGGPAVELASGQFPGAIAVDGTHIYWLDGTVSRVPINGGETTIVADVGSLAKDLALDDTHVYFTASGDSVWKVSKDGGEPISLAEEQNTPSQITVDATHVYWSNAGTVGDDVADGAIMKVAK